MRNLLISATIVGLALTLTGCGGGGSTGSGATREVLFIRSDSRLVARNELTGALRTIYDAGADSLFSPRVSPDGTKILMGTGTAMVVINADGTNPVNITGHYLGDWNADGTKIIAISLTNQVASMNPDGTGVVNIFDGSAGGGMIDLDVNPAGTKVVFSSSPAGWPMIRTMNMDGSGVSAGLTPNTGEGNDDARWSPDGQSLVYIRNFGGARNVWSMNADGTGKTQLTNTTDTERVPVYRSDNSIVYVRDTPERQVWDMNEDGSGQAVLEAITGENLNYLEVN
ncbi:MAG TPA: hypothetical protein PLB31_03225 [Fimbriimonadaceae bacterium]|nr:hypothetical protein [Armatimonadota bacterium]HCM74653.1 hypothetical protein [Armatimonadota bacterium]HRD30297.1 hypothetical protein [Fimbriimonadaceae bacterium]HRE94027.1 hypothetical protein [Fimbriimonadaceae bacterium]HRI73463.1 hypothetical protein [Fimbriimonadaceae bacterium]